MPPKVKFKAQQDQSLHIKKSHRKSFECHLKLKSIFRKPLHASLGPLAECGRFPKRTYTTKESKYNGTIERKKTMGPLKLPDLETGGTTVAGGGGSSEAPGATAVQNSNSPFLFVVGGKNFIAQKNKLKVSGMKDAVRKIK